MQLACIQCEAELTLVSEGVENYVWRCVAGCPAEIDTGVGVTEDIEAFRRWAVREGPIDFAKAARPLDPEFVAGARVYMPQILHHFIDCTWGGCYNSIYMNCLVPYLDSPEVVDYVLRSPVVHASTDMIIGTTGARIYGDLMWRLKGVKSPRIHEYLQRTFRGVC